MDAILLRGLTFYGYHGARAEERALGQRFVVDLRLELDLRTAGVSDDLADTVDYSRVHRAVADVLEGEPRNLIESVAERIAAVLLDRFPPIRLVHVTVWKPGAPLAGATAGSVAVELSRARSARVLEGVHAG
jgi:dihydroneopterin aldolase